MMENEKSNVKSSRRKHKEYICDCCGKTYRFCWCCRYCSFKICQICMEENRWGLTCNNINWECPDCGRWNGYGNQ